MPLHLPPRLCPSQLCRRSFVLDSDHKVFRKQLTVNLNEAAERVVNHENRAWLSTAWHSPVSDGLNNSGVCHERVWRRARPEIIPAIQKSNAKRMIRVSMNSTMTPIGPPLKLAARGPITAYTTTSSILRGSRSIILR